MASADRLIELFHEAKARSAGTERECFLASACGEDKGLHDQVVCLLESHEEAGDFLLAGPIVPVELDAEPPGSLIGRYKIRELLGEGGCGAVYVAEQEQPVRRRVALKVIKLGMDTKAVVARFEAERQALAMMDHPNIARVFDAGATGTGRPFFVMELVRGTKITEYCDRNELPTKKRLALFIKVCHAIQHAHQKGIIHRDIKPSNILVTLHDGVPVPKVIDFGIAKATEGRLSNGTIYTQLHQFVGTPAYMSPEQAEMSGLDIDMRSDIYSLGVLLYELLAGKTPFDADQLMSQGIEAMRKALRDTEPVPPSTQLANLGLEQRTTTAKRRGADAPSLIHLLKGDLDWIVMKCLEKDRSRRYDTASSLADDLQRHLADEPVIACPPSRSYRLRKWIRRNQVVVATTGAVMAALLAGLFLALGQATRANRAERTARTNAYAAEINVAFHDLAEYNLAAARELLDRQRPKPGEEDDLRGFEWRRLWQLCQGDESATFRDADAQAAAFSPDGKLFAYSSRGGKTIVREVASQKVVTTLSRPSLTLSFAPHARLLAGGHDSGVTLWDTGTWQEARTLPNTMLPSLFSPDGRWLLTGVTNAFQLWDTQTWQPVGVCPGAPLLRWQARNAVAFSPDGQFLITVAGEKEIGDHLCVWRLPGMERLPDFRIEGELPGSVAFSADGKNLLIGLWNGHVVAYDFATRAVRETMKEHTAWVTAIAVASNGQSFVTSGSDRSVNLWDATTFKHLSRLRGHEGEVWCVAISPDGGTAVSGGNGGSTKLWRPGKGRADPGLEGFHQVAGFTAGGRSVVTIASDSWCVWTPESGARADFPIPASPPVVAWGKAWDVKPDEPVGALGRTNGMVEIWNLTTGAKVATWPAHQDAIGAVAFSPDGNRLASGAINGDVKIWDFGARRELARGSVVCRLFCLAFSPDGKTLAAAGEGARVWLLDTTTGGIVRQLGGHVYIVAGVAFSPDGSMLATTSFSGETRLWGLSSGKELVRLKGHVQAVTGVAFSSDGRTLATGGMDGKVKLWNVATRQAMATFSIAFGFPSLCFSPDDGMLVVSDSSGVNRRIQLLPAPSFENVATAEAKRDLPEIPAR